jgi:hypothetical protein
VKALFFQLLFFIVFATVFALAIFIFVKIVRDAIAERVHNDASPRLSRNAYVVSKRHSVSGRSEGHTSTSYYVTFEFFDGSREEFNLNGKEYGLLAEADRGTLYSQGSRFQGFDRALKQ